MWLRALLCLRGPGCERGGLGASSLECHGGRGLREVGHLLLQAR